MGLAPRKDPSAYDQGVAAARAALGEAGFDVAAAEGRAMSLEEVVAYALSMDHSGSAPTYPTKKQSVVLMRSPLSPRECEVARLIARGFTNRQVASALVVSPRTADTHVMNILTKLQLHSRAQVAAWAAEHGLLANDT
jgi:non-specific serine/threonine protein kinase